MIAVLDLVTPIRAVALGSTTIVIVKIDIRWALQVGQNTSPSAESEPRSVLIPRWQMRRAIHRNQIVQWSLIHIGQEGNLRAQQAGHDFPRLIAVARTTSPFSEHPKHFMVVVHRQANLFEIVFALGATSRFAGLLHSWEQQCNQHRNDRNHDQQFNQGKCASTQHGQSFFCGEWEKHLSPNGLPNSVRYRLIRERMFDFFVHLHR